MGYQSALLFRWSRRDRLTVVVVAVTAAFLIGTALLLSTAMAYSETFAEPLQNSATVSYETADREPPASGPERVVIPVSQAKRDGDSVRVVGIPADAPRLIQNGSKGWQQGRLPTLPDSADARGPVSGQPTVTFTGPSQNVTLSVVPNQPDNQFLAPSWYVTNASVVDELGTSGYFVIETGVDDTAGQNVAPEQGSPIVSALVYVLGGLQQVLWVLSIGVAAGGLLVLVVVYSVTRMSVRDRTKAIRVIRSTGAPGWRVGLLFTVRALLLTGIGVALGYATGLIAIKLIVNTAVYLGLPIALNVTISAQNLPIVGGVAGGLLAMGAVAGVLAVYPVVSRPPSRLGQRQMPAQSGGSSESASLGKRVRTLMSPQLLSWQSLVPTAATLSVFALTVLLVASIGGLASPLEGSAGETGTITDQTAAHPLNSRLDADSARAISAAGTPASAEIIYAQVRNGQPYMVRGAEWGAFANVTNANLVTGHTPETSDEAVIGTDLAKTLEVSVGETVTLGGSVSPGIRQFEIVGMYRAQGTLDDLLVVPLESVWGLATRPGQVHVIRVAGDLPTATNSSNPAGVRNETGIVVTGLSGPGTVTAGEQIQFTVQTRNFGTEQASDQITLQYRNRTYTQTVTVGPEAQQQTQFVINTSTAGEATARTGEYEHTVRVVSPNAIRIPRELPTTAPPNSGLYVPVVRSDDDPVSGVPVSVDGVTVRTQSEGVAVLPLPDEPGNYTIVAQRNNQTATHTISIVPGADRQPSGRLELSPQSGNVLTSPTVTVYLANPWQRVLTRNVRVDGPGTARTRTVELPPGNISRERFTAGEGTRSAPGDYSFRLTANGTVLATQTYTVTGDERLAAAVASNGQYAAGTSIERSIEGVFGNVQLVIVALIALATLSTVGSTTATFAQAVHARRQSIGIHRSTGATRGQLLKLVLTDVFRIAVPAAILAVAIGTGVMVLFQRADWLVFFGFRLPATAPPTLLAGIAVGGVLLAVVGALAAMVPYLTATPVSLLGSGRQTARGTTDTAARYQQSNK